MPLSPNIQADPLLSVHCLPCSYDKLPFQVHLWLYPLCICTVIHCLSLHICILSILLCDPRGWSQLSFQLGLATGRKRTNKQTKSEAKRAGDRSHLLGVHTLPPLSIFLLPLPSLSHVGDGFILLQKGKAHVRWSSPTAIDFSRSYNSLFPLPLHVIAASCSW